MVLFNISSLILVDGMIPAGKHVVRCALEHHLSCGHRGELGDEVDSSRASANDGDTLAIEIIPVCRPIGFRRPEAQKGKQEAEIR